MRWTPIPARWAQWHDWFAWRPVLCKRVGGQGRWVWLETVRCRYVDVGHMWTEMRWQFCLPGDEW